VEEAVAACGRQDLLDRAFLSDILVGVRPELPPFVWLGDW
jgi:hypothetical protein